MNRLAFIVFMLLTSIKLSAQTSFTGTVTNNEGKMLASVSVMLLDGKGRITGFTKTDKQGHFSIKAPEGKIIESVSFACVGFAKKKLSLSTFKQGMKVVMDEKVQEIKEVTVTPKQFRIKGDTLIYSVLGLRQKQDRTIEDVISRIPGITIDVSGTISYQNIPINTFYVDGKNAFGGDYTLLSKNLSASKVDSVELMRNHQPIKSLQGKTFSESAAINIVMNENAKNVWTGTAELGSGMALQEPSQWARKARIVEMYINKNIQLLAIYKHNNIGENILHELGGMGYDMSDSGILHNIGSIGEGRQGFNNSHLAAINAYKSFDDDRSLRSKVSLIYDKSTTHDYSEYSYLDDASNSLVTQEREASSYTNTWSANIDYTHNSRKLYLNEVLDGVLTYDHSNSATTLNNRILREYVRPHKRGLTNAFSIGFTNKAGNTFRASSSMNYTYLPGRLLLFNGQYEELNINSFTMSNKVQYDNYIGNYFHLSYSLNHNLDYKREYASYNDTLQWLRYHENNISANVNVQYSYKSIRLSLVNELTWINASYDLDKDNRVQYTPSARLNYKLFSFGTLLMNYSHSISRTGFYSVNPLRIYTSYNMASSGTGKFTHTPGDRFSLSYYYTLPNTGLSYGCNYSFNQSHFKQLYESRVENGVYIRDNIDSDSKSTSHNVYGQISYTFSTWRTKLELHPSYGISHFDVIRNSEKVRSGNKRFGLSFSASMRPAKWFYFEESTSYSQHTQQSVIKGTKNQTFRHFNHSLNIYIQPGSWQLKMTNSCSHSKDGSVNFNIYSDAQLSYKTKVVELLLTCKNLWGENKREYKSFSSLGYSYSVTEYRPREIMASAIFSI